MIEDQNPNSLERELAAMTPKQLSLNVMAELSKIIDEEKCEEKRWLFGDRMLMCAMGSGLAAACVIVAMLSMQLVNNSSPAEGVMNANRGEIRASDSMVVLARFGEIGSFEDRDDARAKPRG